MNCGVNTCMCCVQPSYFANYAKLDAVFYPHGGFVEMKIELSRLSYLFAAHTWFHINRIFYLFANFSESVHVRLSELDGRSYTLLPVTVFVRVI